MQTLEYSIGFSVEQPAFEYCIGFSAEQPALFKYYNDWSEESIYWGSNGFNINTATQTKNYRVVGARNNHIYPSYLQTERFRAGVAQQKNKVVDLRFSFTQAQIERKEYEFNFQIELERAEFKTLSVKNEFLILNSTEHQKKYIFAFNVFAEKNSAKIYKRVENANI